MKTKVVYLAVLWSDNPDGPVFHGADLFFTDGAMTMVYQGYGRDKIRVGSVFNHPLDRFVPVRVPEDFDRLDFIPENY